MSLLKVDRLCVDIADRRLLDEVSFEVEPGEVLGLVGESGSGKSMTALAIARLLPSRARQQGGVSLGGVALDRLDEAALCAMRGRDIGMVFQEPMTALNPIMTIGDQVAEGVRLHRGVGKAQAYAIARDVLARVGLAPERFPLTRYPNELSGGQRQRVAIAMAVALKPRLIIADEPTTALDVTTQAQVVGLLRELTRESGAALILITHDLALAADATDRIAVMQQGRIVETGETAALLRNMTHPCTRALRAAFSYAPLRPAQGVRRAASPVLEARELVRDYLGQRPAPFQPRARLRAVDRVSLSLSIGETVGLVGESGCGKSTLLRMLLALERPDAGTVLLDGADFITAKGDARRRMRRGVQAVFQDPYGSFDPLWTVEQIVAEPLALLASPPSRDERRAQVAALLERVGLNASDAARLPHQFSGGQRQRIGIARALITKPAVLALDEATSALDATIRAEILKLLAALTVELDLACLFVSHDLSLVETVTDRVLVMQAGRIVEEGQTSKVFAHPSHPYTAALLESTPNLERALSRRAAVS